MKTQKNVASQYFFASERSPFLEIRTTRDSVLPYAEHFHSEFSLGLILDGATLFFLDGARHEAKGGDIVLIAPGQAHRCNPIGGAPRSYHMLFIDQRWFRKQGCPELEEREAIGIRRPVIRDEVLFRHATTLVEAVLAGETDMNEALAGLLITMRQQGCFGPAVKKKKGKRMPLPEKLLMPQAGSTAETASRSVASLAREAGMRRESYSRAVRRTQGLPPNACMHCLRLELGRRLLRSGKSIAEAALASGYADQSHFHRMFLRYFAATPGCYRTNRSHSYKK